MPTCISHLSDSDGGDFKLTWPRGALLARVAGRRGLPTVRGRLAEASQEKEGKGETARRSLQGRLAKGLEKKRKTWKSCGTDSAYVGRMATISSSWRPFPLGRVLLTLAEWLPFLRHGDLWRPFPKRLSHHVMEDGYLLSPFRNYIILYCKRGRGDDGGSSPIVPGPLSQTGHSFSFEQQAVALLHEEQLRATVL